MTCKKTQNAPPIGPLVKTPTKAPQFINDYKRTKPKFAKPPPPGVCSLERSPLMPHLCPTFPWGGGWGEGLHWLVHNDHAEFTKLVSIPLMIVCYRLPITVFIRNENDLWLCGYITSNLVLVFINILVCTPDTPRDGLLPTDGDVSFVLMPLIRTCVLKCWFNRVQAILM